MISSAELIAKTSLPNIQKHFDDEKVARQVFNAAKRVGKRGSTAEDPSPGTKRSRPLSASGHAGDDPKALEEGLKLPETSVPEDELKCVTLLTNRAPLVLAFAVIVLKYTMPEQPLSSRLSLGQGNVSMNSKSKAQAIGLDKTKSAEEEGWAQGQPKVKVLGRDIPIMRRAGYIISEGDISTNDHNSDEGPPLNKKIKTDPSQGSEDDLGQPHQPDQPEAVWGLDIEALRKSNGPLVQPSTTRSSMNGLPIFSPHAARSYLLRSFEIKFETPPDPSTPRTLTSQSTPSSSSSSVTTQKKKTPSQLTAEKERAAALVLQAIDLLVSSWADFLSREELDKKAWSWYVSVRPNVAQGEKGWGQKGEVPLKRILALKRK